MSSSKLLFYFCISFIIGIFLESVTKIPQFFSWAFLFLGSLIIILFSLRKNNQFIVIGFCILFLVIGILRTQISEFNIANDKLSKFNN